MGPSLLGFLIQSGNSVVVVDVVTTVVVLVVVIVVVVIMAFVVVVVLRSGVLCIQFGGDLFNTSLGFPGRVGGGCGSGRGFILPRRWWVYLKEVTFRQLVSSRQSGMNFPLARSHSLA